MRNRRTYVAKTLTLMLTLTKKRVHKIQLMQRKMDTSMLGITLLDRIPN